MLAIRSQLLLCLCALSLSVILSGCAGRDPHPVTPRQAGDTSLSCSGIESEMRFIETEISRLIPQTEKTGKNVGLGIAGVFFLVPWFFMDLSKAEQIEIDAYRQRYNYLIGLSSDKDCGKPQQRIPDFRDTEAFQQYQLQMQQKQLYDLQQQQLQLLQQQQLQQQINQQRMQLEEQRRKLQK